ncbi:Required for respiratory growth protein 9 mitochondrial [Malassezia pachydermatis]
MCPSRYVHTSSGSLYPRIRPGARASTQRASSTPPTPSPPLSVPWFMEEQVMEAPAENVAPTPSESLPPIAWFPPYLPATTDIPEAVATMLDMCLTGSLSALVARPAATEDVDIDDWSERIRGSPICVIRPMNRSETVGEHGQDWIVIVQVRGAGVGTLKHTAPPSSANEESVTLDAILGPAQVVAEDETETTESTRSARPAGVSRIEHELGQRLPAWQIQKIALERKFPDGWSPMTKLSHEAQHGMRLLHEADPDRFTIPVLSKRFRISPESVRRILRSRWRPTPEQAQRQNERAKAAELARRDAHTREAEEMAALREGIPLEAPRQATASVTASTHQQPVRFEGLVSSVDLSDTRKRQKGIASRGSGDWCLIDAEWCVVHVMTEAARERIRLEEIWRHNGAPAKS